MSYVGQRLKRREDERLLQGRGAYVADVRRPDTLHLAVVRSPHAHARILAVDVTAARAYPGVVDVVTFDDVPELARAIPMRLAERGEMRRYLQTPLAARQGPLRRRAGGCHRGRRSLPGRGRARLRPRGVRAASRARRRAGGPRAGSPAALRFGRDERGRHVHRRLRRCRPGAARRGSGPARELLRAAARRRSPGDARRTRGVGCGPWRAQHVGHDQGPAHQPAHHRRARRAARARRALPADGRGRRLRHPGRGVPGGLPRGAPGDSHAAARAVDRGSSRAPAGRQPLARAASRDRHGRAPRRDHPRHPRSLLEQHGRLRPHARGHRAQQHRGVHPRPIPGSPLPSGCHVRGDQQDAVGHLPRARTLRGDVRPRAHRGHGRARRSGWIRPRSGGATSFRPRPCRTTSAPPPTAPPSCTTAATTPRSSTGRSTAWATPGSARSRPERAGPDATSASAWPTSWRNPGSARGSPPACSWTAPAGSSCTPAFLRWGKAWRPCSRSSPPTCSACATRT